MKIEVVRVRITQAPHLLARILYGKRSVERYAVWTGGAWCWDREGDRVPDDVDAAIRRASASSGVAPPS